jgi:hypothetical protein
MSPNESEQRAIHASFDPIIPVDRLESSGPDAEAMEMVMVGAAAGSGGVISVLAWVVGEVKK